MNLYEKNKAMLNAYVKYNSLSQTCEKILNKILETSSQYGGLDCFYIRNLSILKDDSMIKPTFFKYLRYLESCKAIKIRELKRKSRYKISINFLKNESLRDAKNEDQILTFGSSEMLKCKKTSILKVDNKYTTSLQAIEDQNDIDTKKTQKKQKTSILSVDSNVKMPSQSEVLEIVNEEKETKEETKPKKRPLKQPTIDEFLEYAKIVCQRKNKRYEGLKDALTLKYESWDFNNWKDGFNMPIINWKIKIGTVLPFLKEEIRQTSTVERKNAWDFIDN